jgi:hypothetical protein
MFANESEMVKKPQRKQLPRKKFDTNTEFCRKNVQKHFYFYPALFNSNIPSACD